MKELNLSDSEVAYISGVKNNHIIVYWVLGNFCTYKCSYCVPILNGGDRPYHSTEVIQNTLKLLPASTVRFSGGEPTYHPDFEKIVMEKPDHINVEVLSNAARPFAFWERITPYLAGVHLSYHLEYAQLDRFVETAELIYKTYKKPGRVNMMMVPSKWDECLNVYNTLRSKGIGVTAKPIMDKWATLSNEYTPEQVNWLKTSYYDVKFIKVFNSKNEIISEADPGEIVSKRMNNFLGWTCHVPRHYIQITGLGDVTDTCCANGTKLGNIYTGFRLSTEPIICKLNRCVTFCDISGKKSPPYFTGIIP
jgi:organic radical activating enzyme